MEKPFGVGGRGFVSLQDQVAEFLFLACEGVGFLFGGEIAGDVEVGLALIAS